MKYLDRLLQTWRIRKAAKYLRAGDYVLDIGTADGSLFRHLPWLKGVGVDLNPITQEFPENALFLKGTFPEALAALPKNARNFDAVVLLAVMEHIPVSEQRNLVLQIFKHLKSGGLVILTVPSPLVDTIIDCLKFLRLLDGMEDGQHYGFKPTEAIPLFESANFYKVQHRRFQLGLNNLFVFKKQ